MKQNLLCFYKKKFVGGFSETDIVKITKKFIVFKGIIAQNNGNKNINDELLIRLIRIVEELLARELTVTPVHEPPQARPVTSNRDVSYPSFMLLSRPFFYSSTTSENEGTDLLYNARNNQVGYKGNDLTCEVNLVVQYRLFVNVLLELDEIIKEKYEGAKDQGERRESDTKNDRYHALELLVHPYCLL
ncbi:hypothetical protein BDC45DRAFT_542204 [Circinella umbellata]|nr:hypothetical protein BDC45DRAFT_542204 [Circinella umbellata]